MEKTTKRQFIVASIDLFLLTVLVTVGACFLYKKPIGETIKISVIIGLFALFLPFIFGLEFNKNFLDHDNKEHTHRFLFVYSVSLLMAVLFPLIDPAGWFFVGAAVALSLFSNAVCGLYAVSGLIALSTALVSTSDVYTFIVYFLASAISIILFRTIDERVNITFAIFTSSVTLLVLETAGFVLLDNKVLSADEFIYPIVNVVITSIIIFITLKYFNEKVVNRYRNAYQELNDQEYSALIKLKTVSKDEYFRSIHTAYLTERMAKAIGCNDAAAKNLAYYHRIKKVFSYSMHDMVNFVKENHFPPEAARNLLEFSDKNCPLVKKEASIVYISDKLISTIMVIFEKDSKTHIDYINLIDTLLEKPVITDALEESDLSKKDLNTIKEIMKKEVLYYDFLR